MNAAFDQSQYKFRQTADTQNVQMALGDVLSALHLDARFFIQFFIGEELEFPIPDFHVEAWSLMTAEEITKVALALPRGHAKTTLLKLVAVWHWLFTPYRFILYVSNTSPIAAEFCKDIISYIESDNFRSVFGEVVFSVKQDNKGIYKFKLRVPNQNGELVEKTCMLRAAGAGQQIRGMLIDNTRPELALIDDLEDDENTGTPGMIAKLWKWFFGPFIKALTHRKPKLIFAGNLLSSKSLLHYFCSNDSDWYSRRYGCLRANNVPLWADIWPLHRILADFREYQKLGLIAKWFAEMMNMPIAEGQGLIDAELIPYATIILPGQQEMAMITLDPAISKATYANNSAIVVHAYLNGMWRIAEYIVGKYQPNELYVLIISLCQKWNTRAVGVEDAGYQKALKIVFDMMMVMNNQTFEVCMIHHNNKSKTERLVAWCSLLRNKTWALNEGDLAVTEQLLQYDPLKDNNVDDLIDACSMGPQMVRLYMGVIMEHYNTNPTEYAPQVGYAVCGN